jgi:hypothetical protein
MELRVIVYDEPGVKFCKPLPNDWHLPGIGLRDQLRAEGFDVYAEDEVQPNPWNDIAIYFDALLRPQHPIMHKRSVYISLEPPVVNPRFYERIDGWPYTRILTCSRKHCGGNRHWIPFPVPRYPKEVEFNRMGPTNDLRMVERDRKRSDQLVAITSNKRFDRPGELYSARIAVYFGLGKQLDLYGRGWANHPITDVVNYKGECEHNYETYLQYNKAIVIENQYVEGYASEKYWTPLQAQCQIHHIGWIPDYGLSDCDHYGWPKHIVQHVKEVLK